MQKLTNHNFTTNQPTFVNFLSTLNYSYNGWAQINVVISVIIGSSPSGWDVYYVVTSNVCKCYGFCASVFELQ